MAPNLNVSQVSINSLLEQRISYSRDDEENQSVVNDEAHNLRAVLARGSSDAEAVRSEAQNNKIETHRVDERRREDRVAGVGDDTALAIYPCRLEEDT